jgi:hypothetical protein
MSDGLIITGVAEATCLACQRPKECYYVESTDGLFKGPICWGDFRKLVRLRLSNRPHPDRGTPLFDGNGTPNTDREAVRG